ncbi:MAG: glycoside hydrolase [Myxococcales bacterium]|nr:MAG: glycoside hydrolase [Myxococcales bacterium]
MSLILRPVTSALVLSAIFGSALACSGEDAGGDPGAAGTSVGGAGGSFSGSGSPAGGSAGAGGSGVAGGAGPGGGGTTSGGTTSGGAGGGAAGNGGSAAGGASGGSAAGGAGGSAGGSGGSGGSGGTSSTGGCGVLPVNPNATQQAKNLLCYLYSQYKNHVLSGQQETSWSNPQGDIDWYTTNGMKPPAILGGDYLYPTGTTDRAIAYWKAGGITMIRYHMGAPPKADTYEDSKGTSNLDNVLMAGTAENTSFKSKLDYAATELGKLQSQNVPVLWAPFHEVQANGWFWWSKGTGAQFVAIWKYTFDYLTKTKGLNNLVWLMPFSGSPASAYYPGKEYLDISGPDTYDEGQPFTGLYSTAKGVIGDTIPIPLHETGRIPTPSQMFPSAAPWVLFSVWAGYQSDGTHNDLNNIKSVYADPHTVTRDEVPNLN